MSYVVSAAARYRVELLYDAKAGVAEGPVYDSSRHQLLWVDSEPVGPQCTAGMGKHAGASNRSSY